MATTVGTGPVATLPTAREGSTWTDPSDPTDQAAFDALQAKLVPLWSSLQRMNSDEQTIVVVPSAELDVELTASELQAYEERFLFLLFLLRQPRAQMVFVTGQPIREEIVDYYLDLLGVAASSARRRLTFVSPMEARFRPLTRKLLDRPHIVDEIRDLVPDPDRAHLIPFMTTWDDRELAMRLGIPMYGTDPAHIELGTKTEGRRLFAAAGVRHPAAWKASAPDRPRSRRSWACGPPTPPSTG